MTHTDLQRFIDERHWTRKQFGAALDISQDRLRRFLAGDQRIPRHMALACAALAYGLPPWPGERSLFLAEDPDGRVAAAVDGEPQA